LLPGEASGFGAGRADFQKIVAEVEAKADRPEVAN
jgi:hypothetical protein